MPVYIHENTSLGANPRRFRVWDERVNAYWHKNPVDFEKVKRDLLEHHLRLATVYFLINLKHPEEGRETVSRWKKAQKYPQLSRESTCAFNQEHFGADVFITSQTETDGTQTFVLKVTPLNKK